MVRLTPQLEPNAPHVCKNLSLASASFTIQTYNSFLNFQNFLKVYFAFLHSKKNGPFKRTGRLCLGCFACLFAARYLNESFKGVWFQIVTRCIDYIVINAIRNGISICCAIPNQQVVLRWHLIVK